MIAPVVPELRRAEAEGEPFGGREYTSADDLLEPEAVRELLVEHELLEDARGPRMKVMIVLGTRPEIIRLSRVIARLDELCELVVVHTGQNFDERSATSSSASWAFARPITTSASREGASRRRVGRIFAAVDELIEEVRPERLLVLGDTDSAMRAYVAKRRGVPVFHMEAGNRCFDDRVPEEVNRRLIDQASDVLMPYTERSRKHLLGEGIAPARVLVTGNPIKEVLDQHADAIAAASPLGRLGLQPGATCC